MTQLLIEIPSSYFTNTMHQSGANQCSNQLIQWALATYPYAIIVTGDMVDSTPYLSQLSLSYTPQVVTYEQLDLYEHELLSTIDAFFVSGMDIKRALTLRNTHGLTCPVIGMIHSFGTPVTHQYLSEITPLMTSLDRLVCPSGVTQTMVTASSELIAAQCPVIPHGVDTTLFKPSDNRKVLRSELGWSSDTMVMVQVARLNPFTKLDVMPIISDIEQLCLKNTSLPIKLVLIGPIESDYYVDNIKHYLAENQLTEIVQIVPGGTPEDVCRWYQAADIGLLMSDNPAETFGLSVAEAMATGLPVIVTDVGGISAGVTDDRGRVVPTYTASFDYDRLSVMGSVTSIGDTRLQSVAYDHSQFRSAIGQYLNHRELLQSHGKQAHDYAKSRYMASVMHQAYQRLIDTLVLEGGQKNRDVLTHQTDTVASQPLWNAHCLGVTQCLLGRTTVKLSEKGQQVVNNQRLLSMFPLHQQRYPLAKGILLTLAEGDTSIGTLYQQFTLSESIVNLSIMYLLKHDWLEVGSVAKYPN